MDQHPRPGRHAIRITIERPTNMKDSVLISLAAVMVLTAGADARAVAPNARTDEHRATGISEGTSASALPVRVAVAALENRFVAEGVILDSKRLSTGMHVFRMKIEKVEALQGFANLGAGYQGTEKEFFSEIGAPPALAAGKRVSVILRVSGDEWHQQLFLVEVRDNGPRN